MPRAGRNNFLPLILVKLLSLETGLDLIFNVFQTSTLPSNLRNLAQDDEKLDL